MVESWTFKCGFNFHFSEKLGRDIDLILFAIKYSASFYSIKIFFSFRSKMSVNGTLQERDQSAQITGIDFRPPELFD